MTDEGEGVSVRALVGVAFTVIASWCASWVGVTQLVGKPSGPGEFGDSFGAVNALFSGLALAGVIVTLLMQRRELSLQREELTLTRKELARAAEAQEASGEALARQAAANERAAEIAGLVAIVQHYKIRIEGEGGATTRLELIQERDEHIEALAKLVSPQEGT